MHIFKIEPWGHLILGGIGGYIGYNYSRWEQELLNGVNEKRISRGLVPIDRKNIVYGVLSSEKSN